MQSLSTSPRFTSLNGPATDADSSTISLCQELVDLFREMASGKEKDQTLDISPKFTCYLLRVKSLMASHRSADTDEFLECVQAMLAILKVCSYLLCIAS